MKKLAFLFAAVVAVSFASCGQKAEQSSAEEETNVEAVEEGVCEESCPGDTCTCKCDTTATCACDTCACPEA